MKNRNLISLIIVWATVFAIIFCNGLILEDIYIYNLWVDIFSLAIVLIMLVQYRGKDALNQFILLLQYMP